MIEHAWFTYSSRFSPNGRSSGRSLPTSRRLAKAESALTPREPALSSPFPLKRTLGIDFGRRRLGVALTDELGLVVVGRPTLTVTGVEDAARQVAEEACRHDVGRIVVGLPLNMDGSRGDMVRSVEAFAKSLEERVDVPVVLWDERLSSAEAERMIRMGGGKKRRQKGGVDRLAACLILDSYIQAQRQVENG